MLLSTRCDAAFHLRCLVSVLRCPVAVSESAVTGLTLNPQQGALSHSLHSRALRPTPRLPHTHSLAAPLADHVAARSLIASALTEPIHHCRSLPLLLGTSELAAIFSQLTPPQHNMAAASSSSSSSSAAAPALAPAAAASPPYVWQLNLAVDSADDAIVWAAYSAAESAVLEAARSRKEKAVVLSDTHKADLVKMRQVRRDDPKRWRRIRRLEGVEAAEWIKESERAAAAALLIEDPLRASVNRHRLRVQQLVERTLDGRQPGEISMAQFAEIKQEMEEFKTIEAQAKKAGLSQTPHAAARRQQLAGSSRLARDLVRCAGCSRSHLLCALIQMNACLLC